jgi:hypothetical protein
MIEAENQLLNHQRQLDADGCMVGVSRQAIDEVLAEIERLRAALALCQRTGEVYKVDSQWVEAWCREALEIKI